MVKVESMSMSLVVWWKLWEISLLILVNLKKHLVLQLTRLQVWSSSRPQNLRVGANERFPYERWVITGLKASMNVPNFLERKVVLESQMKPKFFWKLEKLLASWWRWRVNVGRRRTRRNEKWVGSWSGVSLLGADPAPAQICWAKIKMSLIGWRTIQLMQRCFLSLPSWQVCQRCPHRPYRCVQVEVAVTADCWRPSWCRTDSVGPATQPQPSPCTASYSRMRTYLENTAINNSNDRHLQTKAHVKNLQL